MIDMASRREMIGLTAGLLLTQSATAQSTAAARELARQPLGGENTGQEAMLVEVTTPAGTPARAHRHAGFVLGYVLEGELRFGLDGETERVIKAGETFFEPAGALHTGGGSADPNRPVRFLAFIVAPKGSPLSLPA
jgi:quercetin dioxygenase-like cupin family protein